MLDDALVRKLLGFTCKFFCLNPCCAGRCSSTRASLILLFISDCLNPCCAGRCSSTSSAAYNTMQRLVVSILVVMDDALVPVIDNPNFKDILGLNPCCDGRCSSTA